MFEFKASRDWITAQKIAAYVLLITNICMLIHFTGIAPADTIDRTLPILFTANSAAYFAMYRSLRDQSTQASGSGSKAYLFTAIIMIIVAIIYFIQAIGS